MKEDLLKKATAAVMAEIAKQKEDKTTDDATSQEAVSKMVADQLEILNRERTNGDYEEKETITDEQVRKAEFADIDAMNDEQRDIFREEKMLMSSKDIKLLHGNDIGGKIEQFKELNDEALIISTMLMGAADKKGRKADYMSVYRGTKSYQKIHNMLKDDDLRKAMAAGTSGSGAEWIPTGFSSQVLLEIELKLVVPSLFPVINMPTNPYKLPIQTSTADGYLVAENTADEGIKIPASTPGTGNAEFVARKLAGRVVFSDEITEDSIIPIMPFVRQELVKAISRAHENAIINGDREGAAGVASAHQDNTGTALFTSNQDPRLAFDGLRYFALNQTDTSTKTFSAEPSDTLMNQVRILMGKHGVMPSDLVWLMGVDTYLRSMYSLSNLLTLDKYGPNATILKGEIFKYQNIPVVVTEYLAKNLNTTGVYDGSTTDNSMLLLVYRDGFYNGYRSGLSLASEMDIETDQIKLVAKRRLDFVDPYDATATGNVQCAGGVDITAA